jgi:hypothetical protein
VPAPDVRDFPVFYPVPTATWISLHPTEAEKQQPGDLRLQGGAAQGAVAYLPRFDYRTEKAAPPLMRFLLFKILSVVGVVLFVTGIARDAHADGPRFDPGRASGAPEGGTVPDVRPASGEVFMVELYTVGPSSAFPSRFGHSLLCVRPFDKDTPESGTCYDYGVADREDLVHIAWTAIRGMPSFIPVTIAEDRAVEFYRDQGRQIDRQRVPLTAEEAGRLVAAMNEEVVGRRAYAYHPYRSNCATRLRDHIDAASNGRLRKGSSTISKETFRALAEEGHSGRIGMLAPMALYLGEGNDGTPSAWEAMFLPAGLRDGVADSFAAPPVRVSERVDAVLQTSRTVGRIALIALAFALMAVVRMVRRRGHLRAGVMIVGFTLGALALSVDIVCALVIWPEVSHNWALALLLPTDLALPYLSAPRLAIYAKARLALLAVFAVLEIVNVIHQPLLPLAILAALPLLAILSALRDQASSPATQDPAQPTASVGSPG